MRYKIGDICLINKRSYSTKGGYDFVNYLDTGNITKNSISQIQYIDLSSTKLPSRAKRIVQRHDIIYSTVRPNQEHYGFIKETPNNFLVSTGFAVLTPDQEKVDPYWLYYYLTQKTVTNQMQLIAEQNVSTYPSIRPENLAEIGLDLPDLETQQKIVRILSALDQKIELNNQQNKIIEKQASTLVKKYINGEKNTAKLKEMMSFDNGFAFKSKEYADSGKYRVITIKNVQDGLVDSSSAQFIKDYPKDIRECHKLSSGDVLLSLTGNVGRVGIVFEENLLLNQRVAKLKPKNEKLLPFLYFLFRQKDFKQKLEALAKGTAQLNLSPVETLEQIIPFSEQSALRLNEKLGLLYRKIIINNRNNKTLSTIRDSLLPKLMSGEINLERTNVND